MNATAITAAFVIPGDIDLPTGGYGYDRRVMALLPAAGVLARHVALPGAYPSPTTADLTAARLVQTDHFQQLVRALATLLGAE